MDKKGRVFNYRDVITAWRHDVVGKNDVGLPARAASGAARNESARSDLHGTPVDAAGSWSEEREFLQLPEQILLVGNLSNRLDQTIIFPLR